MPMWRIEAIFKELQLNIVTEAATLPAFDLAPTIGSREHGNGDCKPCAFAFKGCQSGVECRFCHLCEPGEKQRRRKEKKQKLREARQLRAAQLSWLPEHTCIYSDEVCETYVAVPQHDFFSLAYAQRPHALMVTDSSQHNEADRLIEFASAKKVVDASVQAI